MVNSFFSQHFSNLSENITATSLSRNAKLITLAAIQRREIGDVTKMKKDSKGLFKKKEKEGYEE